MNFESFKLKFNCSVEKIKNIKNFDFILALYFFLIAGIASMCKGVDRSFDVRNYHVYNPYAFLYDRYDVDIMPADIQSYFNPIMDIPYYLMLKHLNDFPYVVAFFQGTSYAFLMFMIYKIAALVFKKYNRSILIFLSVLVGSTAALTLYNIGTLMHDIFVADLVLVSIYFILKSFDEFAWKNIVYSSFILGCICGLKLTTGSFGIAIILALMFFVKHFKNPFKVWFTFVAITFLGFLFTNGFWMIKLYSLYGNPFMPYFNNIFHSDYVNCADVLKEDFRHIAPHGIKEFLFYPFYFYQHLPVKGFEMNYQDFRFAAIYLVIVLNLLITRFVDSKVLKDKYGLNFVQISFLLLVCVFTYIIWINVSPTVRYLTPASALAGVIVFAFLIKCYAFLEQNIKSSICFLNKIKEKIIFSTQYLNNQKFAKYFKKEHVLLIFIIWAALYLTLTTIEPVMLKRMPIYQKALYVEKMDIPNGSVVITVSGAAMLIPFQNPNANYVYLNASRFTQRRVHILSRFVQKQIREMVKDNPDKTYIMLDTYVYKRTMRNIKLSLALDVGINFNKSDCKVIMTNITNNKTKAAYALCKAEIK